jgi:hypothetical protein
MYNGLFRKSRNSIAVFRAQEAGTQPRSQALSFCGAKTLVGTGHVTHRKLIA